MNLARAASLILIPRCCAFFFPFMRGTESCYSTCSLWTHSSCLISSVFKMQQSQAPPTATASESAFSQLPPLGYVTSAVVL